MNLFCPVKKQLRIKKISIQKAAENGNGFHFNISYFSLQFLSSLELLILETDWLYDIVN